MTFLKTILAGITIGSIINTVYDLQDFNYIFGTSVGIFVTFAFLYVILKSK